MRTPSSFCSLSTKSTVYELELLLGTLAIHHEGAKVFCMVDTHCYDRLNSEWFSKFLDITWFNCLDLYTNKTRSEMETKNEVTEFWNNKNRLMELALEETTDTIFLDADQIILSKIEIPNGNYSLGLSPHRIPVSNTSKVGYYNGGMVWCSNKSVPKRWRQLNTISSYVDQQSLEPLSLEFYPKTFEFDAGYNLMPWSMLLNNESKEDFLTHFSIINNNIYYNFRELKSIHTHLRDARFEVFNSILTNLINETGRYKESVLINKSLNGKHILTIPKQPRNNIYNHNNDSFREMAALGSNHKNSQYEIVESQNTNHCWLEPCIILDDRPTKEWRDCEFGNAKLILQGNGDVESTEENHELKCDTKPWIFWPRNPGRLESYLSQNPVKTELQRIHKVSFIGNVENSIQELNRCGKNWQDYCDFYHLSRGNKHAFTPEEYFQILSVSKYGLCLPGYGLKCHREIECMALGTVPIVTKLTPMHSFANPLEKDTHYLLIHEPADIHKVTSKNNDRWNEMSRNCIKWFNENVVSNNWFKTTIISIMK